MSDRSDSLSGAAYPEGFAEPIIGLLTFLFALFAGMSLPIALQGSPTDLALPLIFLIASYLCFSLRQRVVDSPDA